MSGFFDSGHFDPSSQPRRRGSDAPLHCMPPYPDALRVAGERRCRRSVSAFKQPYNERQRALLREFREFRDFDDISTVSLAEFELALADL